jgi:hypothetical protein
MSRRTRFGQAYVYSNVKALFCDSHHTGNPRNVLLQHFLVLPLPRQVTERSSED